MTHLSEIDGYFSPLTIRRRFQHRADYLGNGLREIPLSRVKFQKSVDAGIKGGRGWSNFNCSGLLHSA